MPCTTILVGKNASYDGSTMIARTDDGHFDVKKLVVKKPDKKKYKSVNSHLEIELPEGGMRYTCSPSVDLKEGLWEACGINEANVGMTATETITSNPRVLGADPLVEYKKAKSKKEKDTPGGIGEEDMVTLVLPYIRSAREGVLRLGTLLETYGTYEMNGIAFNDAEEIWWLETIGGHHWIARRVQDDEVVIMPNQFGLDRFDFEDAYGKQKSNMCSGDLKEFVEKNHLDLCLKGDFNPRLAFGSHDDMDHIYNTSRAWFMGRYFLPRTYKWEGDNPDFTPESDDIPWAFVPEKKVTVEDVKYILSSHYQGTEYDPYLNIRDAKSGHYRPIGINRTGVMAILQIRGYMPEPIRGIEWICFASTTFDTVLPVYTNVDKMPDYLSDVTLDVSTENFYWASRLVGTLADHSFAKCMQDIDRYQLAVPSKGHQIINEYDKRMMETEDFSLCKKANKKLCAMAKEETTKALNSIILHAGEDMTNGFTFWDN